MDNDVISKIIKMLDSFAEAKHTPTYKFVIALRDKMVADGFTLEVANKVSCKMRININVIVSDNQIDTIAAGYCRIFTDLRNRMLDSGFTDDNVVDLLSQGYLEIE